MDLWTEFLGLVSQVVTPIWNELIQYIPLLLLGVIPLFLVWLAWIWRSNAAINASRLPAPAPDGPAPAGLHLPSPSIWPLVAPIGLFLLFLSLVLGGDAGPNLLLLMLGLGIAGVAAFGWALDALGEYDRTEAGDRHLVLVEEADGYRVPLAIPSWIHLPPPSAWPFLAPIGLFFAFLGLVLGPVMTVGGLATAAIAAIGWTLDAGREYHEVADGAHADPALRDPVRAFPRRLWPVYIGIAIVSVLLTLAPWALTWLPKEAEPASGPVATVTPVVTATSALKFDVDEIVVPADTPFIITFQNLQEGVDHNVEVFADAAKSQPLYTGEVVTGPATIEYPMDAIAAGEYPYICSVHPNMTGNLIAL